MIKLDDTYTAAESVVARKVGEEMVLLDLESGQYFGLDDVGSRIWDLLSDEARTLSAISGIIHAEFDAPSDLIETDIVALAGELADKKLIAAA